MRRVALVAVVLVAAGCGSHEDFHQNPAVVTQPAIRASTKDRRALQAILARMAPTHLRGVRVAGNTLTVNAGTSVRAECRLQHGWDFARTPLRRIGLLLRPAVVEPSQRRHPAR